MLLDPETLALTGGVERLLGPPGLKTELFSCLVETNTPVCETALEALAELERLRGGGRASRPRREGLVVAATGAHPFSQPEEQESSRRSGISRCSPSGRRRAGSSCAACTSTSGWRASSSACATLEAVLPWLPAVLALSVNSPYLRPRRARRAVGSRRPAARAAARRAAAAPAGPGRRGSTSSRRSATTRGSGGTSGRIRASARSRSASPTSRPTSGARPRSRRSCRRSASPRSRRPRRPTVRATSRRGRAAAAGDAPVDDLLRLVEPAEPRARDVGARRAPAAAAGGPSAARGRRGAGPGAVAADLVARSAG